MPNPKRCNIWFLVSTFPFLFKKRTSKLGTIHDTGPRISNRSNWRQVSNTAYQNNQCAGDIHLGEPLRFYDKSYHELNPYRIIRTYYEHIISAAVPGTQLFLYPNPNYQKEGSLWYCTQNLKDLETNKPISVPKWLVNVPLREAYTFFKEEHSDVKIGLTKFADLRPAECI